MSHAAVDDALLARYAKLIVEVGANIQPGQHVLVIAAPSAAPLVRAVAAEAYARGARFVDPWYFDPYVKRDPALERAPEDTLEFVPSWYGRAAASARRGARRAHLDLAERAARADGRHRPGPRRPRPAARRVRSTSR